MFARPHANSRVPGNVHLRERKPRAAGPNPSLGFKGFPEEISAPIPRYEKNSERVPSSRARRGGRGCRRGSTGTPTGRAAAGKAAVPGGARARGRAEGPRRRPPDPATGRGRRAAGGRSGERPLCSPSPAAGGRLAARETEADGWRHSPGTYRSRRPRGAGAALTSKPGSLLRSPKGP